ncbi:rod shape-determining protein MreD [Alteriqipengyuania lutimaris]|uniref:rod shape-determining protein MreD n=1 Tax=Alteriqipengyuania lutimaris TaxID=1538146 RepID=UPI001CFE5C90|nr:rod shape-determining protein MreD [Alteriqipengyuania lutimaris]
MIERRAYSQRSERNGRQINRDHSPFLLVFVPWATIMLASYLQSVPIAVGGPLLPPIGFLFLLAWRLLRPGVLPIWAGIIFGMWDDLFSGQPFGSGILFFSATMMAIEIIDIRFPWRGFAQDWLIAAIITVIYIVGTMLISGSTLGLPLLAVVAPQLLLSLIAYPFIAFIVSRLDKLRLMRFRTAA